MIADLQLGREIDTQWGCSEKSVAAQSESLLMLSFKVLTFAEYSSCF